MKFEIFYGGTIIKLQNIANNYYNKRVGFVDKTVKIPLWSF